MLLFYSENPSPEPQVEVAPLSADVVTVEEPGSEEEVEEVEEVVVAGASGGVEAPTTHPTETLAVGKALFGLIKKLKNYFWDLRMLINYIISV